MRTFTPYKKAFPHAHYRLAPVTGPSLCSQSISPDYADGGKQVDLGVRWESTDSDWPLAEVRVDSLWPMDSRALRNPRG